MTERQVKVGLKIWHRWLGAVAAVFLLVGAGTGFLLQHPDWLGPRDSTAEALAVDPSDPDRWLRGFRWGVEESTDGGATWRELPMLVPPEKVRRIHFVPGGNGRVFALSPDLLVTSADGGRVWEEIRFARKVLEPGTLLRDVAAKVDGTWLVLAEDGLLVSKDRGATWIRTGQPATTGGTDWRQFVHDLHTGHVFGAPGRRVAEFSALAAIFLTLSGLFMMTRRNGRRSR